MGTIELGAPTLSVLCTGTDDSSVFLSSRACSPIVD